MTNQVYCLCAILSLAAFLTTGCSRDQPDTDAREGGSTLRTVADGVTGRTAIKAGQHARDEIERIAAERDRELEAVLGD